MKQEQENNRMETPRRGLNRREMLRNTAGLAALVGVGAASTAEAGIFRRKLKGNVKQSVAWWCYEKKEIKGQKITLEAFARNVADMGIQGVDEVDIKDWPILKKYGLVCAIAPSYPARKGLNRVENHAECLDITRKAIEASAVGGCPSVFAFSGLRDGMDDEEGLKNSEKALKQVVGLAEQKNVTICLEMLNSKVNHKDYMADHTAWGVELCKRVGSPRVKLVYDIYHMQIMEGDIIRTIQDNIEYIGHVHTGGVPGRNEIDETQELYYPAIMRALLEKGYNGFVGHEFLPKGDPMKSLKEAVHICDV